MSMAKCGCGKVRLGFAYDPTQCHDCWLYFHDDVTNRQQGGPGIKVPPQPAVITPSPMPSMMEMAQHLKDDLIKIGEGILAGTPLMTENDIKKERLATCLACEHYDKGVCRRCGCVVNVKAMLASMVCPLRKWIR